MGQSPRVRMASGAAMDRGGEYSTEVPQPVRMEADHGRHSGTVTCGDGRGWMCCLLFASRGSGVRVPLAPPGVSFRARLPEWPLDTRT